MIIVKLFELIRMIPDCNEMILIIFLVGAVKGEFKLCNKLVNF